MPVLALVDFTANNQHSGPMCVILGIEYCSRGFEKLSPDWLINFNIFLRCENVLCPGWLGKLGIVCYFSIPVFSEYI